MNLFEIKILALFLSFGSLVGYHFVALHNAVDEAKAKDKAEFVAEIQKLNDAAKADHDNQQGVIDQLAKSSQPQIAAKLDSINGMLNKLKAEAVKPPVVFKADCVMPADQVTAYNGIK